MYSLRGIVHCITLILFSTQPIFCEIIRFDDGDVTYEYDNSSKPLGRGIHGVVYEGIRSEGNRTESIAFKELTIDHEKLRKEANMCAMLSQYGTGSFPKFYRFFPKTNGTEGVLAMERIGKSLRRLRREYEPLSPVTVAQIGLQVLDILEWMHGNGLTHNDLHADNIATGYHNRSKIYLIDFGHVDVNKSRETTDLERFSYGLYEILSNSYEESFEFKGAFKEFGQVASEYSHISDDEFRNETFGKLRSILMTELESHKNDADLRQFDIGEIQDAVYGINLLRKLIKQNDSRAIENLLQTDRELNVNSGFGNYSNCRPIHYAAQMGNADVVLTLIKHGVEVNFKYNETHYRKSPLHYAANNGNAEVVRILCEHGAVVNATDYYGKTSLHYAAMNVNADVAQILIDHGAEINVKCNNGYTPLYYALQYGRVHTGVVEFLVENGAKVNIEFEDGSTPLHHTARYGNVHLIQLFIDRGLDIAAKDESGKTALHFAAINENVDVARFLIERGAEINVKSSDGTTPLHYAVSWGRAKLVQLLIERGADIEAENGNGKRPFHFIASNDNIDVAQILHENGAKIDAKTSEGKTPLHYTARSGKAKLTRFLIDHGADIKAVDNHGQTPLDCATENDTEEVANILREAGQKSPESMEFVE